ncbi:MAG: hypothetical protein KBA31_13815 [Alphaproteobacteria bacterium]|nr:hypothetical protein [Alphaproteobacteria bacterium]
MSWSEAESRRRVREFLQQTPEIKGDLPTYAGGDLYARQRLLREYARETKSGGPLDRLSPSTALVVDAVHVYVRLLGFDDYLLELNRETEASHRRALTLLHFYYVLLDLLVREGGGVRVDFHAARLHFIVAEPVGANAADRVARALAIIEGLEQAAASLPAQLGLNVKRMPLRVGIDQGPCIAIANDSGHDTDVVFLGTPANIAAKLANGDEAGVYASPGARQVLGLPALATWQEHQRTAVPDLVRGRARKNAGLLVERAVKDIQGRAQDITPPQFTFQRTELPLARLKFSELSPSRTVRMEMAALFADIDQFTNYVDQSLRSGAGRQVVRTMFVLREEQRAVLRKDYRAKRLRFVGDCVIGLSASGDGVDVSPAKTVEDAVQCAAALHGSLQVCREEIVGAEPLGLQIGVAYGVSPITRLGIRGDMSVRCAASRSIMEAERHQGMAERGETIVAESALSVSTRVSKLARTNGAVSGSLAAVESVLSAAPLQLLPSATVRSSSPPAPAFRAHSRE